MSDPTPRTREAAARVRAFLDTRSLMGGPIDHTVIHSVQRHGEAHDLLTADLREILEPLADHPSTGGIGTRTPSVSSPHDSALRELQAAAAKAAAAGARTADLFRAVLAGQSGVHLGDSRHALEGYVFEAIADAVPSPLEGMLLQPGQSYADRGNYAVLSITRDDPDNSIDVQVVP